MRIYVRVAPKSGREKLEKLENGNFKVWVKAAPEKGKANEEVRKVLAGHFGVARCQVEIVGGKSSRDKIVNVAGDF